jgi:hypothetical protein
MTPAHALIESAFVVAIVVGVASIVRDVVRNRSRIVAILSTFPAWLRALAPRARSDAARPASIPRQEAQGVARSERDDAERADA